jgi:hypothetical protein
MVVGSLECSLQFFFRAKATHANRVLEKRLANPLITRPIWHTLQVAAPNNCSPSRISESLRLSPCHNLQFWALIAVAAFSQKVDFYHVKNRRL